jgi:hypothetical protein
VTAPAALCHEHPLGRINEIVEQFAGFIIVDCGTDWNADLQIFSAPAVAITPFTVPPSLCAKNVIEAKFQKSVLMRICNKIDIAPATAVATAGAAPRNVLLSPECD